MNSHPSDVLFDQVGSRSPGTLRQPHQTLNRHNQRPQMNAYGNMANPSFMADDQSGRYDGNQLDQMGLAMQGRVGGDFYNMGSAQSWNPGAFANGNLGGTNAFSPFGSIGGRMRPPNRPGRGNLPNAWIDSAPQMPSGGAFTGLGLDNTAGLRHQNYMREPEEELIPTAIVIKNIPFAVKKEQLTDLMQNMNLPLPYAFNYHFDNGVFRGLAFANFTSPDETATVIDALNHYDLNGRKLRVEYKKMLPLQERERIEREKRERRGQLEEQHRPMNQTLNSQASMSSLSSHIAANSPSPISTAGPKPEVDLNDPETLSFYNQMLLFKDDASRETLIFPSGLSPIQRRTVHTIAHNLSLHHSSSGNGDARQVHVSRLPQGSSISPPLNHLSSFHPDPSRRVLNRAATTDFSESRDGGAFYGTLRPQQSGPFLGVPDSPGGVFSNRDNLRSAKSFADLRSYTPSPVPSSASFPAALQSNVARYTEMHAAGSAAVTGGSIPPGSSALHQAHDEHPLLNGFANMSVGTNIGPGLSRGSPRTVRNMVSWEHQGAPTAPIGSNRNFSMGNHSDGSRERNPSMPIRQPSIPTDRGPSGFSRNRQTGHQSRGSDETRLSQPDRIPE